MEETAIQPQPAQTADLSISGSRFISPLRTLDKGPRVTRPEIRCERTTPRKLHIYLADLGYQTKGAPRDPHFRHFGLRLGYNTTNLNKR